MALIAFSSFLLIVSMISIKLDLTDSTSLSRSKRDLNDIGKALTGAFDTLACTPKLVGINEECDKDYDSVKSRWDSFTKDDSTTAEVVKCCLYTEYVRCVANGAEEKCGTDAAENIDAIIDNLGKSLGYCKDYRQVNSYKCENIKTFC